jgi:hypothetical protein
MRYTRLRKCVKCKEQDARVGICMNFYVLSTATKTKSQWSSPEKRQRQVKGPLGSARGLCADCFLKFARARGLDETSLTLLEEKLQSDGQDSKSDSSVGPRSEMMERGHVKVAHR